MGQGNLICQNIVTCTTYHNLVTSRVISPSRAHDLDHLFLKEVIEKSTLNTPEYNGYNDRITHNQRHSIKPPRAAIYTPLIDIPPSNPDTIMFSMIYAQRLTNKCGPQITVFTNDQQLYQVAVNISHNCSNILIVKTLMSNTGPI